ncbi:4-hydroxy-3-methylbut-2-en-1-yl diphosphate synthase [Chlamydia ibidis]|uniref:4-hydroxy-3-methylbut-2-en-1-yl diphosphate synthase (flavodoxin) n=3 Tax=Chlamydia ibidis TaxID=1405396 RepID=S7J6A3_9CHLA|nr:4-hydroxy-3-methylbut-2-en-1-yl diphosphate synthase [Chlamydia ibidis]EQM62703.1 4-hydroxy-3-methylbut-2-en-1-yl diphosphate synthase [Chlamydia ibidis 10-1398/6]
MTTTPTADVEATTQQICSLAECGCDIVRVTVQGIKEAQACEHIKERLLSIGVDIPIIADIHFFPQAAMHVTDFVDKVRINPGNFVDKRNMFIGKTFSEEQYVSSLARIEDKFSPLVEKCKRLGKAMRIGVNHGSLSERIMQRYGDTIEGMVASALEYIEICEKLDYHDVIFSMKSSNPKVMVAAYRQLARDLDARGWHYPLHLGVTEAGLGIDGMIKSSVGIGTLLTEGLGDTIRCSLTGCPTQEIPVCKQLLKHISTYQSLSKQENPFAIEDSEDFVRSPTKLTKDTPWGRVYGVFIKLIEKHLDNVSEDSLLQSLGINTTSGAKDFTAPDGVVVPKSLLNTPIVNALSKYFLVFHHHEMPCLYDYNEDIWNSEEVSKATFVHCHATPPFIHSTRYFFQKKKNPEQPIKLVFSNHSHDIEEAIISTSIDFGALLLDGLGDAVVLDLPNIPLHIVREIAFGTLQSASVRLVKTEFISCPGCGRTLFDLPTVTKRIQEKTKHLSGLKIAVMGCIVNGPGEMADADFGFVGSKSGMIDLYVKHTCVKAHIPMDDAEDELIRLLQDYGVWKDPE